MVAPSMIDYQGEIIRNNDDDDWARKVPLKRLICDVILPYINR